jgi:SAM-dependent methyltransferase
MIQGSEARPPDLTERWRQFRRAYAAHRAREGRGGHDELALLPHVARGPLARQWRVRACSFRCFVKRVLRPLARAAGRPLTVLDLGAGNGWLSYRLHELGHRAIALDMRTDTVDGLGVARAYRSRSAARFHLVAADFERLPFGRGWADLAVFNASLHYAIDLPMALRQAVEVLRPEGRLVILDSPFYDTVAAGEAMVREKHQTAAEQFGDLAEALTALPFVEYLTPQRLRSASEGLVTWRRHRVLYPLAYELRPLIAALARRRQPSRFDVWEGRVVDHG